MSLCALACAALPPARAAAQNGVDGLCALFLHREETELEDLELEVGLEETRLEVAEELFVLVEGLWNNDLFERLPYLGVKHRRDAARISVDRARQRVARQQALVEQYRLACAAPQERAAGHRRALEEAHQHYLEADCALRALDAAAFETDLQHQQEILESARELRLNDVASRQQVLFAERDVELTLDQLEQAMQRIRRCGERAGR